MDLSNLSNFGFVKLRTNTNMIIVAILVLYQSTIKDSIVIRPTLLSSFFVAIFVAIIQTIIQQRQSNTQSINQSINQTSTHVPLVLKYFFLLALQIKSSSQCTMYHYLLSLQTHETHMLGLVLCESRFGVWCRNINIRDVYIMCALLDARMFGFQTFTSLSKADNWKENKNAKDQLDSCSLKMLSLLFFMIVHYVWYLCDQKNLLAACSANIQR